MLSFVSILCCSLGSATQGCSSELRLKNPLREICTAGSVREETFVGAMVDLNGHEAGNGGYSQVTPTALRTLLYSERGDVTSTDRSGNGKRAVLQGSLQTWIT